MGGVAGGEVATGQGDRGGRPTATVRVPGFPDLGATLVSDLREEGSGWEESTDGGRQCVGGRQGGGAPPTGVVVADGRQVPGGGVTSERLGEGGNVPEVGGRRATRRIGVGAAGQVAMAQWRGRRRSRGKERDGGDRFQLWT